MWPEQEVFRFSGIGCHIPSFFTGSLPEAIKEAFESSGYFYSFSAPLKFQSLQFKQTVTVVWQLSLCCRFCNALAYVEN